MPKNKDLAKKTPSVSEVNLTKDQNSDINMDKNKVNSHNNIVTPSVRLGKIILFTKDGCIVESVKNPEEKVRIFNYKFLSKEIGEIIEF